MAVSSQPHRRGRPVVTPYSLPRLLSRLSNSCKVDIHRLTLWATIYFLHATTNWWWSMHVLQWLISCDSCNSFLCQKQKQKQLGQNYNLGTCFDWQTSGSILKGMFSKEFTFLNFRFGKRQKTHKQELISHICFCSWKKQEIVVSLIRRITSGKAPECTLSHLFLQIMLMPECQKYTAFSKVWLTPEEPC